VSKYQFAKKDVVPPLDSSSTRLKGLYEVYSCYSNERPPASWKNADLIPSFPVVLRLFSDSQSAPKYELFQDAKEFNGTLLIQQGDSAKSTRLLPAKYKLATDGGAIPFLQLYYSADDRTIKTKKSKEEVTITIKGHASTHIDVVSNFLRLSWEKDKQSTILMMNCESPVFDDVYY